jgi:tRNA (guanine37-N1)-methyltransferase
MRVEVLTLFPELIEQVAQHGMPRIAVEQGALSLKATQLRDFSHNRWKRVDERPYGGGPGMVLQAEPLTAALKAAREAAGPEAPVLLMSPQGERFDQRWAEALAATPSWIVVCGRYEGLDERVLTQEIDAELSLGDFVLSGGELAVMAMIDAVARLLPGVLGGAESAGADSFSQGLLDHPHYTKPLDWRGVEAPAVLLSGNHQAIAEWRRKQALLATWLKRPDLLAGLDLKAADRRLLQQALLEHLAAEPHIFRQ